MISSAIRQVCRFSLRFFSMCDANQSGLVSEKGSTYGKFFSKDSCAYIPQILVSLLEDFSGQKQARQGRYILVKSGASKLRRHPMMERVTFQTAM